ncbi:glycosyltransferase family 2 protein [Methylobacterium trifolii]|uniref:Chondroitin synthase n=1 Tax=Methylobacterium trifolii TaxID=1003092 RepID=A0ABQ4TXL5_9HYPH|nr:glycosyltransferase family 2 protein [Methylobacterium trifolii]GJE58340.1 Chondroitin synthase [Methylobacterium trifolii]
MSAGAAIEPGHEVVLAHGDDGEAVPAGCVTVAVSLFNYERFIVDALDSVHGQTHSDLDLVVVDDRSTDRGLEAVSAWMASHHARFRRARLLRHRRNGGLSAARNTAFADARTEAVFVLDADNQLYPSAIEKLAAILDRTGAAVAYSQIEVFGNERGLGQGAEWDRDLFRIGNYVDAMALIAKRAWAMVGGYGPLDLGWEDYDLWLSFIEHGLHGVYVPEVLCRYRVHGQSMLRTVTDIRQERVRAQIAYRHPWVDL